LTSSASREDGVTVRLRWILVVGAIVAIGIGWFAQAHTPDYTFDLFGSSGTDAIRLKAKVATVVLAFAAVQVLLALWMYRRRPAGGQAPAHVSTVHRTTGVLLFLATVPVAVHCVFAYGFQTTTTRVAVHSVAGCFFYGAFVSKVLIVRSRRLPGWVLPVAGGTLATVVAILWYSAALWYFNDYRLPLG
jgi:hypothetical protein